MKRVILAVISGILLVLAFPPFGLGFVSWAAFLPLMYALDGAGRKKGFLLGLVFGFVFFLGTVYWVVNSMYHYGGVPIWSSVIVMLAMVLYLSLFFAFFGLFFYASGKLNNILRITLVPAVWVALEFLRGHLFSGFPWILLGYSQTHYLRIIQIADITGVWGISFIIVSVNTGLYIFLKSIIDKEARKPVIIPVLSLGLVLSAFNYGSVRINQVYKEMRYWRYFTAGIAQGSIDQSVKWDLSFQKSTLDIYKNLTLKAVSKGANLIIWPETAVPFYLEADTRTNGLVGKITKETDSYIFTGSPSYSYDGAGAAAYFNSAYLLSPSGAILGRYDKTHLVPFGEYVPLKRLFPFIRKLTAGVGDFAAGPGPIPIKFRGTGIGTLICYEAIFPEIAGAEVKNGATVLINITNDAWFGRSSAPYQHLEMSIMRAVENKTYLLRAANTGISAIVDPVGQIKEKTELFKEGVITDTVRLRQGAPTFYTLYGDMFAYSCLMLSGLFITSRLFVRR